MHGRERERETLIFHAAIVVPRSSAKRAIEGPLDNQSIRLVSGPLESAGKTLIPVNGEMHLTKIVNVMG